MAREVLGDWTIEAFDNSEESFVYAQELMRYFHCKPVNIRKDYFPLETADPKHQYRGRFGKIVLCELLEHLESPDRALANLCGMLDKQGRIFLTMAINIAQEDHVFLYKSAQQARSQVIDAGYRIIHEMLAPAVAFPFKEAQRREMFRKGNYICVAERV